MFCRNCGNRLADNSIFCGGCGAKVDTVTNNAAVLGINNLSPQYTTQIEQPQQQPPPVQQYRQPPSAQRQQPPQPVQQPHQPPTPQQTELPQVAATPFVRAKAPQAKPKSKVAVICIIVAVAVLAVLLVLFLGTDIFGTADRPLSVAELLTLGERYLLDLNFEQALVQFLALIDIEPRNPRGYTGAAEAYVGLGQYDDAVAILEQGLEILPNEPSIVAQLEEIEWELGLGQEELPPPTLAPPPTPDPEPTPIPTPEPPTPEHVTISLGNLNIDDTRLAAMVESGEIPFYVTHLSLRGNAIRNITPLAGLTNLTWLDLGWNGISDLTPLAGLTSLTELDLRRNDISDIAPLVGLTNLTSLELSVNMISDITPLAGLTNLTELWLEENGISDITPLAGLTNLTELQMWYNAISDITPLAGLTNLVWLGLAFNEITDWSPVDHVENVGGRR